MKKIICAAVIILLVLCGCSTQTDKGFFSYQDGEIVKTGVLNLDGREFEAVITMSAPNTSGERRDIEIEYIGPDSISGLVLKKSGNERYGQMGDVIIPMSENALNALDRIGSLFSLTPDMISNITAKEDKSNVASLSSSLLSGEIKTDSSGNPQFISIKYNDGHLVSFKVSEQTS